jgi:hypothetical protein
MPQETRDPDTQGVGDMVAVARSLAAAPGDLEILRARLAGDGIPSFIYDGNTAQMNALWSIALGGTRLMVPGVHAAAAREIIALVRSGAFELGEDEDVGP